MNQETENLVLEHLRRIREGQDQIREDVLDLKVRMTCVEEGLGQVQASVGNLQVQIAGLSGRMDRFDKRLERVEQRLDLVEA